MRQMRASDGFGAAGQGSLHQHHHPDSEADGADGNEDAFYTADGVGNDEEDADDEGEEDGEDVEHFGDRSHAFEALEPHDEHEDGKEQDGEAKSMMAMPRMRMTTSGASAATMMSAMPMSSSMMPMIQFLWKSSKRPRTVAMTPMVIIAMAATPASSQTKSTPITMKSRHSMTLLSVTLAVD